MYNEKMVTKWNKGASIVKDSVASSMYMLVTASKYFCLLSIEQPEQVKLVPPCFGTNGLYFVVAP